MDGPVLWYLNRGTGLVLLVLLTLSVVLGVLALGGRPGRGLPRFAVQQLHRNVALLALVALVAHVATAVLDTFVDIRWWHAVVPFGAAYEPLWVALGTLAVDVVLVVVVTSLLRTRLRRRAWHAVHLGAWAAWALALAHTLGIGSDLREPTPWAVLPTAACVLAVAVAAAYRLLRLVLRPAPAGARP